MKAAIPLLTALAAISTIVTAWWNLAIRRKVAAARLYAIKHGLENTVRVESKAARAARLTLTTCVVIFLGSALLMGAVIFFKTIWELFS